jgi:CheY-like chemotaxis protein
VKDARVAQGQRVLVVDGLSETEEVLRAVLEPRGLQVDRIRANRAPDFAPKRRPSVVVVHVDDAPSVDSAGECWPDVPRILIGATRSPGRPQNGHGNKSHGDHYLEKPFHYGELIRAIERALAAKSA